jgi:hypothetical protein
MGSGTYAEVASNHRPEFSDLPDAAQVYLRFA